MSIKEKNTQTPDSAKTLTYESIFAVPVSPNHCSLNAGHTAQLVAAGLVTENNLVFVQNNTKTEAIAVVSAQELLQLAKKDTDLNWVVFSNLVSELSQVLTALTISRNLSSGQPFPNSAQDKDRSRFQRVLELYTVILQFLKAQNGLLREVNSKTSLITQPDTALEAEILVQTKFAQTFIALEQAETSISLLFKPGTVVKKPGQRISFAQLRSQIA